MKNRNNIYLMILRCALCMMPLALLASCSSDDAVDEETVAWGETVDFAAPVVSELLTTRVARGTIGMDGGTPLSQTRGFGVFGCYTGLHPYADSDAQPNFMYNQHIYFNTTRGLWDYYPTKYWPNGEGETLPDADPQASGYGTTGEYPHYVSFFAYAPYSDLDSSNPDGNPAGYCVSSFSYQHELTNPWLTYRLIPQQHLARQVDLLCATPLIDQTKPHTADGRLQFRFGHALGCVSNQLFVRCSDKMQQDMMDRVGSSIGRMEVVITGLQVEYELTEHGRLSLWHNGSLKWDPILSGDYTAMRYVDYADRLATESVVFNSQDGTKYWMDDTHGVFYIPMHIVNHLQTATFTLAYDVRHYTTTESTIPVLEHSRSLNTKVTLSDYIEAYQPGRCLNFVLIIDEEMGESVIHAVSASLLPWDVLGSDEFTVYDE